MKHVFKIATLSLLCANAFATPIYHPSGPNLTYGAVSNNQSIISNITNPAAGAAVFTKEDSQYRFGILSSVGFGYEFGQVDNLYDEMDTAQATLDAQQTVDDPTTICDTSMTDAQCADAIATELNATVLAPVNVILTGIQEDGYASGFFSGHLPIMPLVISHTGLGGSFVVDVNASTVAKMTFLSDPAALVGDDILAAVTAYPGSGSLVIPIPDTVTDSAMVVKAAAIAELALGYSRPVVKTDAGELMAGFRAKYYMVGLSRTAQRLMSSTGAENTFDASNDYTKSSGIGLDVGALWVSKNYRAGAWIDNVNKPSFKFNEITDADLTADGYTDSAIRAELKKGDEYEMKTQGHLEGAVYTESQNWVVNVGLDSNAIADPVGNEYQWATLSAGYATDSWWIPGFRVGYRTNMAGSELSYLTTGVTAFKSVTLDLAYSLDSVTIEGETAPRSVIFNLGVELSF